VSTAEDPTAPAPDDAEGGALVGAPGDAGYRAPPGMDPTRADPAGIPDPTPDDLGGDLDPVAHAEEAGEPMEGQAPTG
jgi:hypothetical protein